MSNWRHNLRRWGTLAAADEMDRAIQRTCMGRIVSLLTLIFIVLCVILYGGAFLALNASGIGEQLRRSAGGVLTAGLCVGFFLAIILAGLIGNWLRRRIWQALLRRRGRYGF